MTSNNVKYSYPPFQFSVFRIILGIYLSFHFIFLIPFGWIIWSSEGTLPEASLNPTFGFFPDILNWFDSPVFVTAFLIVLLVTSLAFTFGFMRRACSFILWYGWACLFNRNNLIIAPCQAYIGWLLLSFTFIPPGEPFSLHPPKKTDWKMPKIVYFGAWFLMALGYTLSGVDKLRSPSWIEGSAIDFILKNPMVRVWSVRDLFLSLPPFCLKFLTWLIIVSELLFLPFALFKQTRFLAWSLMVIMHIGILLMIDFADLTIGMFMIHLFTFDVSWISPKQKSFLSSNFQFVAYKFQSLKANLKKSSLNRHTFFGN